MPQKDAIHEVVKQAVIKDGWNITKSDDPYIISYGEKFYSLTLPQLNQIILITFRAVLLAPKEEIVE